MKKILILLLAMSSLTAFSQTDISEFERGFKEGKSSCISKDLYLCNTPDLGPSKHAPGGWVGGPRTGTSRTEILKNLRPEYISDMIEAGKDLKCTKL